VDFLSIKTEKFARWVEVAIYATSGIANHPLHDHYLGLHDLIILMTLLIA
jgi:hypothetical protein